ncbi:hypothetical protein D3C81_1172740 [compost metagenome]
MREDFLFHAHDEHVGEFQALGGVQGHHLHTFGAVFLFLLAFEHVAQHQLADGFLDGHATVFVFLEGVFQRLDQEPDVAHAKVRSLVAGTVGANPVLVVDVHDHAAQGRNRVLQGDLLADLVHPALESL